MYRCKKCGTYLTDWRGHAEVCPQAGMPESIEVAPPITVTPQYVPFYPYIPQLPPYRPWWVYTTGRTTGTGNTIGAMSGTAFNG